MGLTALDTVDRGLWGRARDPSASQDTEEVSQALGEVNPASEDNHLPIQGSLHSVLQQTDKLTLTQVLLLEITSLMVLLVTTALQLCLLEENAVAK